MDDLGLSGDTDRLNKLPVRVSVRVCGRLVTLDQFMDWVPGTILSFEQPVSSPLTMCVGSCTIGEGQAVKVGAKMGVRVLRVGDSSVASATGTV